MGVVDRKQLLLENVSRLRSVARRLPGNEDLAAVRLALEDELGQTVSRRAAARLLGVSHTALQRWVDAGDLPLVRTSAGRTEVPVAALLDLYESLGTAGEDGPGRYRLAPTMTSRRRAAARLRLDPSELEAAGGHARASARSLAYHRAVAPRLDRGMVAEARHALRRWRRQGRIDERHAQRWAELLSQPLPAIRRAIVARGADADDLRQTSPLAGLLSEPERRRIFSQGR